jgi:hypothetical protein
MSNLVAFFDILGTKDLITCNKFDDLLSLDFTNPVGIVAARCSRMRCAVFSDSVILSSELDDALLMLKAIGFIYTQWFSDYIFVRGAIALGKVRWVDDENVDKKFKQCRNFMYARVYGQGLVDAHTLEGSSGPGAICFLTEGASKIFLSVKANSVLSGPVPALVWADRFRAENIQRYLELAQERAAGETHFKRHILATKYYFEQINKYEQYMPDEFCTSLL